MDLFNIQKLKQAISDYVRIKVELFKLDITEHVANILAQVIAYFIIISMLSLVLVFSTTGIAFLLNDLLDSVYLGFLITAGFYLLILIIVFILLKSGKLKAFFEKRLISEGNQEMENNHKKLS